MRWFGHLHTEELHIRIFFGQNPDLADVSVNSITISLFLRHLGRPVRGAQCAVLSSDRHRSVSILSIVRSWLTPPTMTDTSVPKPNGTPTAPKPVPDPMSFPETGTPLHEKPSGYELYRKIGSPRHIVAPMVDHSELAWRILSRRYGSDLVYTPMINAKVYVQKNRGTRRVQEAYFNKQHGEEGAHSLQLDGSNDTDRPLIVQVRMDSLGAES